MRRIRMMIGALLAAACLVPATAFALGASSLTLASPEVREGTSDIALVLQGQDGAARDVSSVRVTLSVVTADPEDASLITGATVVDAPSSASVARAVFDSDARTVDVIVSAGGSALSDEGGEAALGALRLACAGEDVAVRVSVLGVEALGASYNELRADAPAEPVDMVLNAVKEEGEGGSGSGSDSDSDSGSDSDPDAGGGSEKPGDEDSDLGSGGSGAAGGSAGSSQAPSGSSAQSSAPLAATGDPLSSIALSVGIIAVLSYAAVALAAVSLRRSIRKIN